jgi:hypothetical protein
MTNGAITAASAAAYFRETNLHDRDAEPGNARAAAGCVVVRVMYGILYRF